MTDESGTFQTASADESYLDGDDDGTSSPKRARYETSSPVATEIVTEQELVGDGSANVQLTVPQTQFEIEINSHQEEGDGHRDMHQIEAQDLAGPTFAVIEDDQALPELDSTPFKITMATPSSQLQAGPPEHALNAIGRALLQMQQQQTQGLISAHASSITQNPLMITSTSAVAGEEGSSPAPSTPLYVMIPPSSSAEILQAMQHQGNATSRPIAPKLQVGDVSGDPLRSNREQQRKATHNEVERRRRDRINELIKILAQMVPGCQKKDATTGTIIGYVYSKGTVLDKTVEYLKELISQNEQLASTSKLAEKSANAVSMLQSQITVLEKENAFLRAQIMQFGIDNSTPGGINPTSRALISNQIAQAILGQSNPPAPTPVASQAAAQQLLASIAQTLTNPSQGPTLMPSQLTPAPRNPSPQLPPLSQHLSTATVSSNQTEPLLNSLVQTLASLTHTTTTPANPVPRIAIPPVQSQPPPHSQASFTAAASLLNTLLMAQNILGAGATAGDATQNIGAVVLNPVDQVASSDKQ